MAFLFPTAAAQRALRKLGEDIGDARRRRRIQTAVMAERAQMSRATLHKLERGDPAVSMGAYATVLFVLGMIERLSDLADARFDRAGLALEEEHLPKRIRSKKVVGGMDRQVFVYVDLAGRPSTGGPFVDSCPQGQRKRQVRI